jgi:hypothetical protein
MIKKALPISAEAKKFLINLLEEAGMDVVSKELRDKMLADLAKRLDARLTLAAISALPEEKVDKFEDMLSENKSVLEIVDFLSDNVPNIAEVYAKALVEFKRSYLS